MWACLMDEWRVEVGSKAGIIVCFVLGSELDKRGSRARADFGEPTETSGATGSGCQVLNTKI